MTLRGGVTNSPHLSTNDCKTFISSTRTYISAKKSKKDRKTQFGVERGQGAAAVVFVQWGKELSKPLECSVVP